MPGPAITRYVRNVLRGVGTTILLSHPLYIKLFEKVLLSLAPHMGIYEVFSHIPYFRSGQWDPEEKRAFVELLKGFVTQLPVYERSCFNNDITLLMRLFEKPNAELSSATKQIRDRLEAREVSVHLLVKAIGVLLKQDFSSELEILIKKRTHFNNELDEIIQSYLPNGASTNSNVDYLLNLGNLHEVIEEMLHCGSLTSEIDGLKLMELEENLIPQIPGFFRESLSDVRRFRSTAAEVDNRYFLLMNVVNAKFKEENAKLKEEIAALRSDTLYESDNDERGESTFRQVVLEEEVIVRRRRLSLGQFTSNSSRREEATSSTVATAQAASNAKSAVAKVPHTQQQRIENVGKENIPINLLTPRPQQRISEPLAPRKEIRKANGDIRALNHTNLQPFKLNFNSEDCLPEKVKVAAEQNKIPASPKVFTPSKKQVRFEDKGQKAPPVLRFSTEREKFAEAREERQVLQKSIKALSMEVSRLTSNQEVDKESKLEIARLTQELKMAESQGSHFNGLYKDCITDNNKIRERLEKAEERYEKILKGLRQAMNENETLKATKEKRHGAQWLKERHGMCVRGECLVSPEARPSRKREAVASC